MPFGSFQSLEDVSIPFQVRIQVGSFLQMLPVAVDPRFAADLDFCLQNIAIRSESGAAEFLIAPVLREVWRPYSNDLLIWSHVPFKAEPPLVGTPDWFFSRRTSLGLVPDLPYVLVVEAKRDDFDAGWGQCLAAMLAAQKLNGSTQRGIFGCVTNGRLWEFAKLFDKDFTQEVRSFALSDLAGLFAALNTLLALAREQALASAA